MRNRWSILLTGACITFGMSAQLTQSPPAEPTYAAPQPMPFDRADDSYTIYAQLLTRGPIEWRDVKRSQWLVEQATTAVPLEQSCATKTDDLQPNPLFDIEPSPDRLAEWKEIVDDYQRHCHDRLLLQPDQIHTSLPVHLLSAADAMRYHAGGSSNHVEQGTPEFADAAGLHSFSEIYFNAHHTLALVHIGMWCGGLCGNWSWVVLEKKGGGWKMLPWVHSSVIS